MTMTPAEVLEEMQPWKGIKRVLTGAPPIEEWADALEKAMREPVAYLSKTLDSHGNMRSRELSWVPIPSASPLRLARINHPLFTLPPNAVGIINEQQREIERMREALRNIAEVDDDMGIYPAAVRGFHDERDYEQRDGYKNGWNAACTEFTQKAAEIIDAALAGKEE